ncbi:MAG: FAD-dependent oxidoreductase, partial [Planctomycetota bacterium]
MQTLLGRNTVVLFGVGHTNAHILKMWKMRPPKNAQLICVSDFPVVTYSGMLPGVIAGQYPKSAMEIDLVRLTQSAGARLIIDEVVGLEASKRQLLFTDRPPFVFDALSIGIGSRPSFTGVSIEDSSPLIPVKPMQTFLFRLRDKLNEIIAENVKPRIVIVGGGVGSLEIAFCLWERFFGTPKYSVDRWPNNVLPKITLLTGGDQVGAGLNEKSVEQVRQELDRRGIEVRTHSRVVNIDTDGLTLKDNAKVEADVVLWATNAVGAPILYKLGLPTDEKGFLLTDSTLQVQGFEGIF